MHRNISQWKRCLQRRPADRRCGPSNLGAGETRSNGCLLQLVGPIADRRSTAAKSSFIRKAHLSTQGRQTPECQKDSIACHISTPRSPALISAKSISWKKVDSRWTQRAVESSKFRRRGCYFGHVIETVFARLEATKVAKHPASAIDHLHAAALSHQP